MITLSWSGLNISTFDDDMHEKTKKDFCIFVHTFLVTSDLELAPLAIVQRYFAQN